MKSKNIFIIIFFILFIGIIYYIKLQNNKYIMNGIKYKKKVTFSNKIQIKYI